jgi:hypothetical protein
MGKKPKHKQRIVPVALSSTNEADLFLLAGIPNPLHLRIREWLQALTGSSAKVIAVPGQSDDGIIYKQRTVKTLVEGAARFAIRRLKNRSDDQTARPRRIVLFYVPAYDEEILLEAFDFFVFPIPLRDLAQFDDHGGQKRHQRDACETELKKALEVYYRALVGLIERKIQSRKSHEPLLLPPENFHLEDLRIRQAFSEVTRGSRAWENPMPKEVRPESFDMDRLPHFLAPNERQEIYKDTRGIVFPAVVHTKPTAALSSTTMPNLPVWLIFSKASIVLGRLYRQVFITTPSLRRGGSSRPPRLIALVKDASRSPPRTQTSIPMTSCVQAENRIPQRYYVAAAVDINGTSSVTLTHVPAGR